MEIILRSVFPPTPGGGSCAWDQQRWESGTQWETEAVPPPCGRCCLPGVPQHPWNVHQQAGYVLDSAVGSVCTENANCLIWCWSLHTGAWSEPSPFTGGVAHILQRSIKSLGNCSSHMSLHSVPLAWHLQVSCFNFTVSYFCSLFLCHSFSLTILTHSVTPYRCAPLWTEELCF